MYDLPGEQSVLKVSRIGHPASSAAEGVRQAELTASHCVLVQVEVLRQDLRTEELIGVGEIMIDGRWPNNEFDG